MVEIDSKAYTKWVVADYRRRMKARAVEYKGGKCEECGYSKCQPALEFHHRDPSKKDFRLSAGNSWSWVKIQPELDKCTLLCATCHREAHFKLKMLTLAAQEAAIIAERNYLQKPTIKTTPRPRRPKKRTKLAPPSEPETHCHECGVPTNQKKFCSQTCFRLQREHASWPADADLRDMVWAKPATTLAEELGVSSVAVKKRCRHRGIETPPRGYCAKLAAGKV